MCLCLHHLRALLSSIPLGHSLFPALLLWSHLHTTLKTQRRVGLITITIIALPILLVETHHQRGDAEIMMVKILFFILYPEVLVKQMLLILLVYAELIMAKSLFSLTSKSTSKANISIVYLLIIVQILLKRMSEKENLLWHMLIYFLDLIVWLWLRECSNLTHSFVSYCSYYFKHCKYTTKIGRY